MVQNPLFRTVQVINRSELIRQIFAAQGNISNGSMRVELRKHNVDASTSLIDAQRMKMLREKKMSPELSSGTKPLATAKKPAKKAVKKAAKKVATKTAKKATTKVAKKTAKKAVKKTKK